MKTKKMLTLMLAVMLLVASLAVTAYAEVPSYTFSGKCTRSFTTTGFLEREDKDWTLHNASITCSNISFPDRPNAYSYGYGTLTTDSGTAFGSTLELRVGEEKVFRVPSTYTYGTVRARLIHPYYNENGNATASYKMHIAGTVAVTTKIN